MYQNECFMKLAFPEMTNEAYCWGACSVDWSGIHSGDCRNKQGLGAACMNAGGNYDNNNCVTGLCSSSSATCERRTSGCGSFSKCVTQGTVNNDGATELAARMLECYDTVVGVGDVGEKQEKCTDPETECKMKYKTKPRSPSAVSFSLKKKQTKRRLQDQHRYFADPWLFASSASPNSVSADVVAALSSLQPAEQNVSGRRLLSFTEGRQVTKGPIEISLSGTVDLQAVNPNMDIDIGRLTFDFELPITIQVSITLTVSGSSNYSSGARAEVFRLSHNTQPCYTASEGGQDCMPYTIFQHNPKNGKIPVFIDILAQAVAQLDVEVSTEAEFFSSFTVSQTFQVTPQVYVDLQKPENSYVKVGGDAGEIVPVAEFSSSGKASARMRLRIGPQLTLRVQGFQFKVFQGAQVSVRGEVAGSASANANAGGINGGTCLKGQVKAGAMFFLGLDMPTVDTQTVMSSACEVAMNVATRGQKPSRRLQGANGTDIITAGRQLAIPDDVRECMVKAQQDFCHDHQCCLTVEEYLAQEVPGGDPFSKEQCTRSLCGSVTTVVGDIIGKFNGGNTNPKIVRVPGRCSESQKHELEFAVNIGSGCSADPATLDFECASAEDFEAPLDFPKGCSMGKGDTISGAPRRWALAFLPLLLLANA